MISSNSPEDPQVSLPEDRAMDAVSWVVLGMAVMIFFLILMVAMFCIGVIFERRFNQKMLELPGKMVKTKGGDRLHIEGICKYTRNAEELITLLVCSDCRKKSGK